MGTHLTVLSESYPMNTNMPGFRLFSDICATLLMYISSFSQVIAVASWDSSIHDSIHLNRLTPSNERVYMILKCVVRLSHPAAMEVVLRKRICINIYKRQSLTDKLRKTMRRAVTTFTFPDPESSWVILFTTVSTTALGDMYCCGYSKSGPIVH